jgi:hypothetical protein
MNEPRLAVWLGGDFMFLMSGSVSYVTRVNIFAYFWIRVE